MESRYSFKQIVDQVFKFAGISTVLGLVIGYVWGRNEILLLVAIGLLCLPALYFFGLKRIEISRKHIKGIEGELMVRGVLSLLNEDEYRCVHDVVIRDIGFDANIDHLVIGKTGVWLIETKNWSSKTLREYKAKKDQEVLELPGRAGLLRKWLARNNFVTKKVFAVTVLIGEEDAKLSKYPNVESVTLSGLLPLITRSNDGYQIEEPELRRLYALLKKYSEVN